MCNLYTPEEYCKFRASSSSWCFTIYSGDWLSFDSHGWPRQDSYVWYHPWLTSTSTSRLSYAMHGHTCVVARTAIYQRIRVYSFGLTKDFRWSMRSALYRFQCFVVRSKLFKCTQVEISLCIESIHDGDISSLSETQRSGRLYWCLQVLENIHSAP